MEMVCTLISSHKKEANTSSVEPAIATALKECIHSSCVASKSWHPLLIIGTTDSINDVSKTIRSAFRHEIHLEVPVY